MRRPPLCRRLLGRPVLTFADLAVGLQNLHLSRAESANAREDIAVRVVTGFDRSSPCNVFLKRVSGGEVWTCKLSTHW